MRLSFFPGRLFLEQLENQSYELRHGDQVVGQFKSRRQAISAFNVIRQRLESKFPARETTDEEKRRLLIEEAIGNSLPHNSLRNAPPRKSTGTRTFG